MVDGSKFWSDDVVEIVPVDAAHAYFRAELAFYNGHSCSIAGVAKAVGNKLVYREKQASYDGGPTCRLTITTKGKSLLLDDGDGSCQSYCGARGSLSGFDFIPLSSKRPIGYMWSEHCSYKSSRIHLKKLPTKAPWVIQGPGENAGVIDIGDGDACIFKMESHNHPSFIEPYQGAATGVGGIMTAPCAA